MALRGQEFRERNAAVKLNIRKYVEEHKTEIEQQAIPASDVVALFWGQAPRKYLYSLYAEVRKELGIYSRMLAKKTVGLEEFMLEKVGEPQNLPFGLAPVLYREFTARTGSTITEASFRNRLMNLGYRAGKPKSKVRARNAQMKEYILKHKEDLEQGKLSIADLAKQLYGITDSDLYTRDLTQRFVNELGINYSIKISEKTRAISEFMEGREDWKTLGSHAKLHTEYVARTGSDITYSLFSATLNRLGYAIELPSVGDTTVHSFKTGKIKYYVKLGDNNWKQISEEIYQNNEVVPNCALACGMLKVIEKEAKNRE